MLHQLHGAHPGHFALKNLATLYIWWPKIYHELLVYGENCIECVKADKKFQTIIKTRRSWEIPSGHTIKPGDGVRLCRPATINLWKKKHARMRRPLFKTSFS